MRVARGGGLLPSAFSEKALDEAESGIVGDIQGLLAGC